MKIKQKASYSSTPASALKPGYPKQDGNNNPNNHYELITCIIGFMLLIRKGSIFWELTWGIYLIITLERSCHCMSALIDLFAVRLRTGEWNYEYLRLSRSKLCRMMIMWLIYACAVAC